ASVAGLDETRSNAAGRMERSDGRVIDYATVPLPDGQTMVTFVDVTERLDLESRYNSLIQVQGETIDHLAEGVAVFGSDGRLRLQNPSFARIWNLPAGLVTRNPHVAEIVAACRQQGDDAEAWTRFTASVAGLDETRSNAAGRMERSDGRVIDYATVPLPDGQTMVTFVDVTDTERVARALVERNEALEAADAMKNAFIHHVSYELRSPLTNIIGFTQLLADTRVGALNDRQREYVGYVMSSSTALLAIVNDILDLATIDAGIMELDLSEVDIAATVDAAVEGVKDRIAEGQLELRRDIPRGIGSFIGDAKRIRQILFNLLANAVEFSRKNGRVLIAARRGDGIVEFTVADEGPGIPTDFLGAVFDPFASRARGEGRGGAGLGLSIVRSFAELHGGTVDIQSEEGRGATVRVRLPARPGIIAAAAE
ncbi:MAG: PAS-domain containing protein, partial [Rhizobiales bacterium]|nr:PAS-domain containing protein [Hyphomicrobiales bacterium]